MAGRPRTVQPLPAERQQQGEELFTRYHQRALRVAWKFSRAVPSWLTSREELEAAALEGLWYAVLRDRPERGSFDHYWIHPVCSYCRNWLQYVRWRYRATPFSAEWSGRGMNRGHEYTYGHHIPMPIESEPDPKIKQLAEQALALLNERARRLFVLHYWHDWPLERAATEVGYGRQGVYNVRNQHLSRLRKLLAHHAEEGNV